MGILDRLRETIELIAPDGQIYNAQWQGNARTLEKKVGLFNFPKVQGTKAQDLEVNGDRYPLTIFFEGTDNDKESDNFWKALKLKGRWEVVHPLYGSLFLQLLSAVQDIQPVNSVNRMTFETEWMEPLPDGSEVSLAELEGAIEDQSLLANLAAVGQYVENVISETYSQIRAVANAVNKVVSTVKKTVRKYQNFDLIPDEVEVLVRGITETLSDTGSINTTTAARQVQQLVQINVGSQATAQDGLKVFSEMGTEMGDLAPSTADEEGLNTASSQELATSAIIVALAQSALLPGIETRSQAVEAAQTLISLFNTFADTLDETQELFSSSPIEIQYYSQSQAYFDSVYLIGLAVKYLLSSATELKTERRFTLQIPRNFVEICAAEYGLIDDDILDFFIESNNLTSLEIRCIPAGREVSVFI